MKFCQVDGAELVSDEPAFDPYATVVGHNLNVPAQPVETASPEVMDEPVHQTVGSTPIAPPDEVLELPGLDPLKTMYVSESDLKDVFEGGVGETMETPTVESFAPESESSVFSDQAPPPSPFSTPDTPFEPIQSQSPFADAETVINDNSPFQTPELSPVADWNPQPIQTAWPNQPAASNAPVAFGVAEQNKGLAIGSLVCGVLSCTVCCSMGILLGPAALVMGFMAKKKADEYPSQYGGRGLALGGMITGAVGVLFGIGIILYYLIVGAAVLSGGLPN